MALARVKRKIRRRAFSGRVFRAGFAAGAISVGDCAKVLRIRGNAMQDAVPAGKGAMAALLGASPEQAGALCAAGASEGPCEIANDNAPGQIVISGAKPAVELAISGCKRRRCEESGACCPYLRHSIVHSCNRLRMPCPKRLCQQIEIKAPSAPLVANVTATARHRCGCDTPATCRSGDRPGALDRIGPVHGRARRQNHDRGGRRKSSERYEPPHGSRIGGPDHGNSRRYSKPSRNA